MDRFRQEEDEMKWFESETPHFHKVILPDTLKIGKLHIPKNFIHKHGRLLSDNVFLKVPDGKIWRMDLVKSNEHGNMVWMSGGWRDFVRYYSISSNFFIVFRYEGDSKFSVMIFGTTMLEIDYPCNNSVGQKRPSVDANESEFLSPKIEEEEEEEDDNDGVYGVLESSHDVSSSRKSKAANEKAKAKQFAHGTKTETASSKKKMHLHCSKHDLKGKSGQLSNLASEMAAQMPYHSTTESSPRARTLEAASGFKLTCPFFQIVFSKDKMKCSLHLPNDFVNNLEKRTTRWVTLKVLQKARSWRVNMWCYLVNSVFKEARFCAGWTEFTTQVPLRDRDVCNFKLVNQKDMVFHVFVCRGIS